MDVPPVPALPAEFVGSGEGNGSSPDLSGPSAGKVLTGKGKAQGLGIGIGVNSPRIASSSSATSPRLGSGAGVMSGTIAQRRAEASAARLERTGGEIDSDMGTQHGQHSHQHQQQQYHHQQHSPLSPIPVSTFHYPPEYRHPASHGHSYARTLHHYPHAEHGHLQPQAVSATQAQAQTPVENAYYYDTRSPNSQSLTAAGLGDMRHINDMNDMGEMGDLRDMREMRDIRSMGDMGDMGDMGNLGGISDMGDMGHLREMDGMDMEIGMFGSGEERVGREGERLMGIGM